ncbi:hypothetical protein UFOVP658_84 [uncultured Caudovirales phage]|uniref:Uncharacterized protein n=1 Tax=uncultured Caudovirales phage TaxID=2100421 RepID=A0A6J5NA80_9CAUD|nr:hypothetical protein UFOVP658_84 [uncultured Caudovirales phage]
MNNTDGKEKYLEEKMEQAAPAIALDKYLKELSIQVGHSPHVQVSVTDVVDKLLDIRNLMADVIIDGDEMAIASKSN